MKGISGYAVVYDISSDKERTKIDKLLKGFGFRIQKSVFECMLDKGGKNQLVEKLKKLGIKTGFVKVYKLEHQLNNEVIGKNKKDNFDAGSAYII